MKGVSLPRTLIETTGPSMNVYALEVGRPEIPLPLEAVIGAPYRPAISATIPSQETKLYCACASHPLKFDATPSAVERRPNPLSKASGFRPPESPCTNE